MIYFYKKKITAHSRHNVGILWPFIVSFDFQGSMSHQREKSYMSPEIVTEINQNTVSFQRKDDTNRSVKNMHCGLWTTDCGLRTKDYGLRTADCGLRTADGGLRTADCGLRTEYKTRTEV